MPRFQKTRKEKQDTKKLKAALKTYAEQIEDEEASAHAKVEAQRAEKQCQKQLKELEAGIAARKLAFESEVQLTGIQEKFPESVPVLLPDLQTALYALGTDAKFLAAKQYLADRIKNLQAAISQEIAEQREATQDAENAQINADFIACEKARKEINNQARPYFLSPHSLESRGRVKEAFLTKTAQWRAIAATRGDALDETGASQKKIAEAYSQAFERLAQRVEPFEYDIEWQPSNDQLEKLSWFYELPMEENWIFRSATGQPSEEQARLRVALLRFYQLKGYSTDAIPVVPFPTKIPQVTGSRPIPFEFGAVRETDRRAKQEEHRLAEIERLRIEDPAAFKKLTKDALTPIQVEDAPVVYYCQRRTLDNPTLSDILYWPSGAEAVVGEDIHFDSVSKTYYVEDIAIEWIGPSQKAQRSDEELEIENQLSVARELEPWNAHIYQKPRPIVSTNPVEKSVTPFYRQTVQVIQGDHFPLKSDPRNPKNGGEFRHGVFYPKDQCDAVDKQTALYGTRIFDGVRSSEPTTLATKPDGKPRDSLVWAIREREIAQIALIQETK